jgi:cytochrome c
LKPSGGPRPDGCEKTTANQDEIMKILGRFLATIPILLALGAPNAAADPARGRALFDSDCAECHTLQQSEPAKRGPHLENLFNRRYGAAEGFEYRMVWTEANPTWTPDHLNNYLNIHGRFDTAGRADLIEFLQQSTKAP